MLAINSNNQDDNNENFHEKKEKRSFFASSLVTVLIIFIFAIASVASYVPIRNSYFPVEDNVKNYIESSDFIYNLTRLTRSLQQAINESSDWYEERYVDVKSVKYNVKTGEEKSLSNMADISEDQIKKEIKDSLFYMKATFDENGNPEIETSLGNKFDKGNFINNLTYSNNERLKEYSNLEVVYIIPQDFEAYDDIFTASMKDDITFPDYAMLILIIGSLSILILIIAAFAIPYSKQNEIGICRGFNKMFLELKFFVWIGFIGLCAIVAGIIGNSYTYYGNEIGRFIYDAGPEFYLVGIILTTILYLLIYLSTVYLKYIYHNGLKNGLIDNSLFGKIFLICVRKIRDTIKRLIQIDLREDNYRKLIAISGINLLAILILGSGGFLGFILAAGYSLFIFKYLLKIFDKAKELNDASSQVAEGNFDINIDEDMGILSPMAKNLNNINKGFSLAVDREIKSQRMKAELISNVSHDLKTPLTSIITYVDLLKNEDLDLKTKKEYIEILDKKSQRLKVLIEDLFEASKASSGNVDLNLENIDIVALFKQTMGELEEKINDSTLQFKINAPENKVLCSLDGRRTYRVFENIMTNILKYAMENSRVYIDITENPHEVSFIFKNISAYEMNFEASEIMERFTRGDESRSTEGSGLGLSIAKSLIELQNGRLEISIDGDLFKLIVTFPKTNKE
ncbi:Signal transduction histidine kinase [Natronincola ferrireducens]|uniref:histidine kinase n=1 Tax=Natronincola ferrireducens TaxID=393762 RepID=A0A1G9F0L4_9FIRM|nr:Signal transduction histidine kinase [Natronincola ferrireducens]